MVCNHQVKYIPLTMEEVACDNISEQVDGITTKFSQKFINPVTDGSKLGFGFGRFISFISGFKNADKKDDKSEG